MPTPVSVVIPVLDEEQTLPVLLRSLELQSLLPAEVIVVDGGSADGTRTLVRQYAAREDLAFPIHLLDLDGSRPGRSRNAGTRAAKESIVACSDAGVTLPEDWLHSLVAPLHDDLFEQLVGLLVVRPARRVKLLYAGGVSIAYRKSAWEKVGGYPDDIYPCEDAKFLRDLHTAGVKIARADSAVTYWRPRSSLSQLWGQYRSYAWGDAMIQLGWHRHLIRASFYLVCLLGLSGVAGWIGVATGAAFLALYLLRPTARAWRTTRRLSTWFLGPLVLATKDISQIFGYLEGTWNRMRGGSQDFGRRG